MWLVSDGLQSLVLISGVWVFFSVLLVVVRFLVSWVSSVSVPRTFVLVSVSELRQILGLYVADVIRLFSAID